MEPKPLGKEALIPEGMLREIEYLYGPPNPNSAVVQLVRGYRELLADAMFWRSAVKNAEFYAACPFCDGRMPKAPTRDIRPIEHRPDCAWVLAQD